MGPKKNSENNTLLHVKKVQCLVASNSSEEVQYLLSKIISSLEYNEIITKAVKLQDLDGYVWLPLSSVFNLELSTEVNMPQTKQVHETILHLFYLRWAQNVNYCDLYKLKNPIFKILGTTFHVTFTQSVADGQWSLRVAPTMSRSSFIHSKAFQDHALPTYVALPVLPWCYSC